MCHMTSWLSTKACLLPGSFSRRLMVKTQKNLWRDETLSARRSCKALVTPGRDRVSQCLLFKAVVFLSCRMSEGDSVGDSVHGKPSVVYRFFTRLGQVGISADELGKYLNKYLLTVGHAPQGVND